MNLSIKSFGFLSISQETGFPNRRRSPATTIPNVTPESSKFTPPHQSVDFRWKDYCDTISHIWLLCLHWSSIKIQE
ncbi:hypothetical protein MTR_1g095470 [Medicago truncatula]|uniref:Uncharacterized protein n=1 Tax=Medicago truncatula TaxID=3880 RepID=G7I3C7_MEDTR|nr:hypothetical protein MTR_1g095470 [Medicago truncatula]